MGSPFGAKVTGARRERVLASSRFVDGAFRNTLAHTPVMKGNAFGTVGEFFFGGQRRTPPAPLPAVDPRAAWARPAETGLRATWLGHSTVLVELDGLRILTDPVWGERASPSRFAGPKRFQPVPVAIAALPPLDAVIISHDHYDHLDYPTILALAEQRRAVLHVARRRRAPRELGLAPERIVELDWWETATLPRRRARLTAGAVAPLLGARPARNVTLWSSFAVRGPRHSVFFSGDTGLTPEYADIADAPRPVRSGDARGRRLPSELGRHPPRPRERARGARAARRRRLLPVHWGTFNLAIHAWDDPAETLVRLAPARGAQLVMPRLGAAVEPARVEGIEPWWRQVGAPNPDPVPSLRAA